MLNTMDGNALFGTKNSAVSILYVEDEPTVRKTVETMLLRRFKQVYCASDGQEGLDLYHTYHPDIIITDIQMPRMNGLEMLREIRKEDDWTPVLITSAYNQPHFLVEAIESHADAFVLKPIDKETLLGKIEQLAAKVEQRLFMQVFAQIAQQINKGFVLVDRSGNIIYANPAVLSMTGCDLSEVLARPFVNDDAALSPFQVSSGIWSRLAEDADYSDIVLRQNRMGKNYYLERTALAIRNPFGRITHFMMIMDDVTQKQETVCRLEEAAFYDFLTGAMRRNVLQQQIESLQHCTPIVFAMMDIDHFKHINDTFGHHKGDEVLQKFSSVVMEHLRSDDMFFRWGGEEFLLLFHSQSVENVYKITDRIRCHIASAEFGIGIPVTVSVGIASRQENEPWEETLMQADTALYRAKNEGRNCIRKANECLA